jgi:GNAT superfamily N-acetyltransferase
LLSEIRNDLAKIDEFGEAYKYAYPAVKIARLAIDLRHQGEGYGADIVSYCIAIIVKDVMPKVGCRFIVVDANKPAIDFYRKVGFTMVDTDANKALETPVMFLDLQRLLHSAPSSNAST